MTQAVWRQISSALSYGEPPRPRAESALGAVWLAGWSQLVWMQNALPRAGSLVVMTLVVAALVGASQRWRLRPMCLRR